MYGSKVENEFELTESMVITGKRHLYLPSDDDVSQGSMGINGHEGILIDDAELARETEKFYTDHFGLREILLGDPNQEKMNRVYLEGERGANSFWLEVAGDVSFFKRREGLFRGTRTRYGSPLPLC